MPKGKGKSKSHQNTSPVFRLKPISRSNSAKIRHVGNLLEGEKLGDEIVELDTVLHPEADIVGKHAIPINKIDSFEMLGRLYRCNIIGTHIVVSRRYPMMFLNVHYDRPMVSGSLLQIFFSIDMDKDEKTAVKDSQNNAKYVNLTFTGKWTVHLDCDDELTENYERYLIQMLENDATEKLYKSTEQDIVELRESMSDDQVIEWMDSYIREHRVFYDNLMKEQIVEFKTIRRTRDWFVELCQSEKFYKFLQIAMKCRELHRRKEAGFDEDTMYVVPKNVTKMTDIRDKMIENDELILNDDE